MTFSAIPERGLVSTDMAVRHNTARWRLAQTAVAVVGLWTGLLAMGTAPASTPLASALLIAGAALIVYRPLIGVYLVVFFTLLGDTQLAWWYPFAKNLSSRESVLFVHQAVILSPLELYLLLTALAWATHVFGGARMPIERERLFWPIAIFTGFVIFGLMHGLITGGAPAIALWEVRPLLYLPFVYLLASSLFTRPEHYHWLMWTIVAALVLEAVHAGYAIHTAEGPGAYISELRGYLEHSASLHYNTVFVLLAAAWLFTNASWTQRLLLPVAAAVVLVPYFPAERRSAIVALAAATILLCFVLYRLHRLAFFIVVPALAIFSVAYLVAFWSGEGGVAFPAQAVKSVMAPEQLGMKDHGSSMYRLAETYNIVATIRTAPLMGLGFGHKFLQVFPLPYIEFLWAEYFPHNSILWIWMNTGIAGFVSMLYVFGRGVQRGVRGALRLAGRDGALLLTAAIYVVMYLIYAYVDMAWDTQSMVYLGVALALIDHLPRLRGHDLQGPMPEAEGRSTVPVTSTVPPQAREEAFVT